MPFDPATRARLVALRRRLLGLTLCALAWSAILLLDGGFVVSVGSFRVSSRNPRTPLLLALVGLIAAALVSRRLGVPLLPWAVLLARLRRLVALLHRAAWQLSIRARQLWTRVQQLWIEAGATAPQAILVAVVIAAAVLDFHQLFGAAPLWLDEQMIALNFRDRSFSELGGRLWLEQSAPYGWLVVQRAVLLTLGPGEVALRLVPTLFGILTYLVAFWIARRWLTWPAGLVFVLLCIFGRALGHYRVELKHYSGDAFWALLLPALAVWATDDAAADVRRRRMMIWWMAAAGGLWLANGALLVVPACALLLFATTLRRDGVRVASRHVAWGLVWVTSFALHYAISLRHTAHLRAYWAAEFPPRGAGWLETLRWFGGRLDGIGTDIGGTDAGLILWLLAALGWLWSARPALGLAFAGVAVSGFVYALLRLVPVYSRFSLWLVPALYAGIVLVIDRAVRSAGAAAHERTRVRWALAVAVAGSVMVFCFDILQRGAGRLHMERPTSNHGVDDRTAVSWLISHRQPGDALIATRLGLPALWWYGGISIGGDGSQATHAIYTVEHRRSGPGCGLTEALKDQRRVLVYVGFPDMPKGFDELLFAELDRMGAISAYREEAALSRAAVVDLGHAGPDAAAFVDREPRPGIGGCVAIRPAVRR